MGVSTLFDVFDFLLLSCAGGFIPAEAPLMRAKAQQLHFEELVLLLRSAVRDAVESI